MEREEKKNGKKEKQKRRVGERGCLHHDWNRNDAPLGSISEPLHTMAASPTFKHGNNAKPTAYIAGRLGLFRKLYLL